MKVLLIGGPGNISAGTITTLVERGEECAVYTLPETDALGMEKTVTFYHGNRNDHDVLNAALEDFRPDVVIDFVCFTPDQCDRVCRMIRGKVKQYILVSTVDVYGYPLSHLPMPESGMFKPAITQYAQDKLACEQVLKKYPDILATTARPSYSMGNSFVMTPISHLGGRQLIPRLRNHKPVFVPGDGTTLIHASVAHNTGCMIAALAGAETAFGKAYNCAHEYFITHDDYIGLFGRTCHVVPDIVHIPTEFVIKHFPEEYVHTMLGLVTRYNLAFSIDRFKTDFPGFKWEISLESFIGNYITYCDENNLLFDSNEMILDDRIIMEWKKRT
jgi:nucleoside-diphosphate-sugar epimerase